jgi:hypothetical protein
MFCSKDLPGFPSSIPAQRIKAGTPALIHFSPWIARCALE